MKWRALIAAEIGIELTWTKLLGGIVVGVVTTFAANAALDWYRKGKTVKRLKAALLVHCLETLHKLSKEEFAYKRTQNDDQHDWNVITELPRGYVLSKLPDEPRELVVLLDDWESRLVVRFYERWDMLITLESLYSEVHSRLVEILAACCTKGDEAKDLRHMKDECWEQLRGTLRDLRMIGAELCKFSCQLFQAFCGPSDGDLCKASEDRWKMRTAMQAERDRYDAILSEIDT